MLKNRKLKMLGAIVLILAAILVTLSAVNVSSPASEDSNKLSAPASSTQSEEALVPVTGNQEEEASPVLELPAKTNFTAEIKEEIRAGYKVNSEENSYTAPEENSNTVGPYEFKIQQWEDYQNSQ